MAAPRYRTTNNFGSTAFATWVLVPPLDRPVPQAALGVPAPGYEVFAIDPSVSPPQPVPAGEPGRMAVQGPTGSTYWRLPDKQRGDVQFGYTFQDDLIMFAADGISEYLGRTDFLISTAGNKVAPVEVEAVLSSHPAVLEAVVFGLPDRPGRRSSRRLSCCARPRMRLTTPARVAGLRQGTTRPIQVPAPTRVRRLVRRDAVGKVPPRVLRDKVLAGESAAGDGER